MLCLTFCRHSVYCYVFCGVVPWLASSVDSGGPCSSWLCWQNWRRKRKMKKMRRMRRSSRGRSCSAWNNHLAHHSASSTLFTDLFSPFHGMSLGWWPWRCLCPAGENRGQPLPFLSMCNLKQVPRLRHTTELHLKSACKAANKDVHENSLVDLKVGLLSKNCDYCASPLSIRRHCMGGSLIKHKKSARLCSLYVAILPKAAISV